MTHRHATVVPSPHALGQLARQARHNRAQSIQDICNSTPLGNRFMSELERGKETAQLGKVMQALRAVGLALAVVAGEPGGDQPRSERLGLSFPYDWSNPDMPLDTFILKVLERGRFEDVLKLVRHVGFDPVLAAMPNLDTHRRHRAARQLNNIQQGALQALLNAETQPSASART